MVMLGRLIPLILGFLRQFWPQLVGAVIGFKLFQAGAVDSGVNSVTNVAKTAEQGTNALKNTGDIGGIAILGVIGLLVYKLIDDF